jgi:hypothetical protein
MKPLRTLSTIACLCFSITLLSAEIHTFKSADGSKSFSGELNRYDPATKTVTVLVERKTQTFQIDLLSEEDQTYVIEQGKQLAITKDIDITLKAYTEKSEKKTSERIEDRVYPRGYVITIKNRSKEDFKNLELSYTMHYSVQGYLEPDRKDETLTDKLTCNLAPDSSKELRTKTVDIVTGKMEPLIENIRRRDKDGKFYYESVIKEPGGRRKDLLETCVVDLLIDGKIVKTVTKGKTEEPEE